MSGPGPDGFAVIAKEAGWTSHDVVAKARGVIGTRKIGHSGTLDPPATGLLILGVGRGTRLLRFVTALPKTYVTTVEFGVATTTLDAEGDVTATADMGGVDRAAVTAAAQRFVGDIEQIPPMVSAVKIGGRRLHEIAREGGEVERPPRPVTIHRLDVGDVTGHGEHGPVVSLTVRCSSGTYIRTLAADIGEALGGVAHVRTLARTEVGSFTLADAHPVESPTLVSLATGVRDLPTHVVHDPADVAAIGHGKRLAVPEVDPPMIDGAEVALLDGEGTLLAVCSVRGSVLAPEVVIPPA
ncbi:MAG: tRNA pseudouridine(55) synthase TruB [Acidimicrobiales bacterium]